MRKSLWLAAAIGYGSAAFAQSALENYASERRIVDDQTAPTVRLAMQPDDKILVDKSFKSLSQNVGNTENTVIWSETFANGIPAGWGNGGTADGLPNVNARWEYRGATGAFPATVGSRGAYGNPAVVIGSPTGANGFVIFDSDRLDNNGVAGNFGNGPAPSPHVANLVTPTIDLTGQPLVFLDFYQYYRRFAGPGNPPTQSLPATYVDFSTNGGTSWGNTVTLNSGVAVNGATATNNNQYLNVSAAIGGQDSVRIRFRFEGDYYFWMIDDISLVAPNQFDAQFVTDAGFAPTDFLVGPLNSTGAKMGINTTAHAKPWYFVAGVENLGTQSLTNVQLRVSIMKDGAPYTQVQSPTNLPLASGSTLGVGFLNTVAQPFLPTEPGTYSFYFEMVSNELTLHGGDTTYFFVTDDLLSLDFNAFWNSIGTDVLGQNGSGMAVRMDLNANDYLYGVSVGLSSLTVAGGTITLEIYDSADFTGYVTGFDANNRLAQVTQQITSAHVTAGAINFFLPERLHMGANRRAFYAVIWLNSNSGANLIRIRNDQTVAPNAPTALMYLTANARWFTGYSNSRTFASPWIRSIVNNGDCFDFNQSAQPVGQYSAFVSWSPISGTNPYRLQYRLTGNSNWTNASTSDTSRTIINLAPGTYEYRVFRLGVADTSCVANFDVDCADNIAYSYNVFQAPEFGKLGSVNVFNTSGGRSLYNISLVDALGDTTAQLNKRSATFRNLGQGNYTIYVSDFYDCVSDSVGNFTINALDTSYVPFLISAVNSSPNGFRPIWNRVNQPGVINYQLRVRNATDNQLVSLISGITDTFRHVNNLTPGKLYTFNVRTRYNPGTGAVNSAYSIPRSRNLGAGGNKTEGDILINNGLIFPNPVSDKLNIVMDEAAEFELTDLSGRVLFKDALLESGSLNIDMTNLPVGTYVLRISQNNSIQNQKIIKL